MFISPRTYSASQTPDQGLRLAGSEKQFKFYNLDGWRADSTLPSQASKMLLIHQAGSVRVGEVVRYTLTYTPSADNILPTPARLHVKIKNTSALPLRAAYLHGPYTLYASCYPSTFNPNIGVVQQAPETIPQYEPYLKAGGTWNATMTVPRNPQHGQRTSHADEAETSGCMTWIIEVISQVVFSSTATVNFELLVGRDENSVESLSAGGSYTAGLPKPAQISDHWSSETRGKQVIATKGVYSRSITLLVDDTASLWGTSCLPLSELNEGETGIPAGHCDCTHESQNKKSSKKVHLVVLTHGLHSNLGADMLYLKESIEAAAKVARNRSRNDSSGRGSHKPRSEQSSAPYCHSEDHDDEQVIVRGFSGNATRTERGIQYLGKRLAKYVLLMVCPDQTTISRNDTGDNHRPFSSYKFATRDSTKSYRSCDIAGPPIITGGAHQVTSISFIGHSLGGLVQTYAIAYIQKHFPHFFDKVRPVNFIALATPFLGLSNENPVYVRFALDLGLVGRTGQDLGLSWTAPRVRSGWETIIGGKGNSLNTDGQSDARSKPLLRVLPCGPAHEALSKFEHRTIYSNVVNDGIVPLRTSCLLFLDWKGLDRVEKARRGNGIVGTMAEWGWAELTGANSKSPSAQPSTELELIGAGDPDSKANGAWPMVNAPPQQDSTALSEISTGSQSPDLRQYLGGSGSGLDPKREEVFPPPVPISPLSRIFSILRPKEASKTYPGNKQTKIYKRSQTLDTLGDLIDSHYHGDGLHAPPQTTFFESASDLLMPPLPPLEFIVDPTSRSRTIFHDRIYHPDDIPPSIPPKRRTLTIGSLQNKASNARPVSTEGSHGTSHPANEPESGLKLEEKIARAYHRNLSWRKVLVRLEPDAHNNIIVRRMFTNAYGWPVVQHLVNTHFGDTPGA
ncbi:lipase/serine esterase [Aspergillus heteromorphus CBS 117.55]|uniref:Lipase/serine esterase n=1 Tax=Aspergillus heteromorphus CBS 117.55 TaxID=1448321 RepID=A0A317UX25_9EURO|nr:lipase/serine esterase [Aspergillus heteromorphus CBS 117.55]PWY64530.1 lipase/serine esterase [Aspergillus heteromorphus CBS 117.55]